MSATPLPIIYVAATTMIICYTPAQFPWVVIPPQPTNQSAAKEVVGPTQPPSHSASHPAAQPPNRNRPAPPHTPGEEVADHLPPPQPGERLDVQHRVPHQGHAGGAVWPTQALRACHMLQHMERGATGRCYCLVTHGGQAATA